MTKSNQFSSAKGKSEEAHLYLEVGVEGKRGDIGYMLKEVVPDVEESQGERAG